ncbi:MAG: dienelactone hydrolase family protein [Campylobacterales bacterium]|nr:dienelactone hydrolase family protein [Campylobacterales bacterium]
MNILIICDIYGLNKSSEKLEKYLKDLSHNVYTIDAYKGMFKNFLCEKEAYSTFIKDCNHNKYYSILEDKNKTFKADLIISFSAGASAAWRLSENNLKFCKKIICFYPSQIRNYTDINPRIPTLVVLPKKELTFDIDVLKKEIENKKNVDVVIYDYDHGFMNKSSASFSKKAENKSFELIKSVISGIS